MGDFSRRHFIKLMAVSAAGAVAYTGCTPFPQRNEFLAQSTVDIPEDLVTGVDNWYASVCRKCRGGCGILVRVHQGRAIKIEGNPEYPVNRGALCARGQAEVQELYHPDRIRGPLRRAGDRGSGRFEEVTWETARQELLSRLRDNAVGANRGSVLTITEPLAGHRSLVMDRLTAALGAQLAVFEPLPRIVETEAVRRVFGTEQLPKFDIAQSQYLLSFGADFLGTWLSPVQYNRAYGEFRQGRPNRGYFVQVEPRMSQTGANADEWVPVRPGSEGILALSMAQVLATQSLVDARAAQSLLGSAGDSALDAYAPQRVAGAIGVSPERITELAQAFGSQRPALAIGGDQATGHTNGLFNLTAIYALNVLTGGYGQPGGVLVNPPSPFTAVPIRSGGASFAEWQRLIDRLRGQAPPVNLLLLHGANPVYGLPKAVGFADALSKIPYVVSFSSFMDETTALADLIMPDHVALEAWGDDVPNPLPGVQTVGLQQPVVNPLYNTRDFVDVLLSVAQELGGEVARALPWTSYQEVVRAGVQELRALGPAAATTGPFEQYWNTLLQKGGWWQEQAPATPETVPAPTGITLPAQAPQPSFAGAPQDFPFHLVVYPHLTLGEGELAHLPWLQATPEPTTTAVWQSWVEVNPVTAQNMGLATGDIVAVESPVGSLEVPVYPYPGIAPDVVAMPLGQGHTAYGRWARDRGVNPLALLAPLTESETGALAWAATMVKLRRTGRNVDLPTYENGAPTVELEPGQVVQVVPQ